MKRPWSTLVWLIIITMLTFAIVKPNGELNFYNFKKQFKFSQGLDLQGGIHLKYILDLTKVPDSDRTEAIRGVKNVIENRINPLGITEPVVQTSKVGDNTALIVELPGQQDFEKAKNVIGQTARLTFREQEPTTGEFKETTLTGSDLRPNGSSIDQQETTLVSASAHSVF